MVSPIVPNGSRPDGYSPFRSGLRTIRFLLGTRKRKGTVVSTEGSFRVGFIKGYYSLLVMILKRVSVVHKGSGGVDTRVPS